MKIYLDSIGCRLNWSEIEMLAQRFKAAGCSIASTPQEADTCVVNTCAVTAQAERKTRHRVRSLHRQNPDAHIAVVGCYPTLRPEMSASLPGVVWAIPNAQKAGIARILGATSQETVPPPRALPQLPIRARAFIKAQDGCDNHCTYCVIRLLRGPSRSRSVADITAEVRALVEEAGCQEAVLTGASIGAYGRDLGLSGGLRTLVETLLVKTDLARLRLSSLEPWDIDRAFFELWIDPRLCRQIHLPLQAGCDATLRRMGRPITTAEFAHLVEAAHAAIPDVAVTTDVLVGFPGEDDDAFRESYEFVKRMGFAKLHVFPYSPRPGTPATKLPHQVPHQVRSERARRMRDLGVLQRRRFVARFLGRELAVLWERQGSDGRWTGWTDNYIQVSVWAEDDLRGRVTQARLLALENDHLKGEAIL
ncbi:MAG: tRNA (N(6)-L-threonylcarbamoyladenosine(37)-C(2))-methylthiotransferase MtaB [Anaerolineae bacterium]|jgi:threonylcarbamoyladenosine tRNA methylthiotransferase MtaB